MNNSIRIKIHQENNACVISAIVLVIGALALAGEYKDSDFVSAAVIILFICCFAAVNEKRPTVIKADSGHIEYTHIAGVTSIKYSDIKSISCEPYEIHSRYSSRQRIRLTIYMNNGEEYELNDAVNTSEMLKEQMNGRETDIPLVRLYEFLKEALIKAEGIISDP